VPARARRSRIDLVSWGIVALLVGLAGTGTYFWRSTRAGLDRIQQIREVDNALAEAGAEIRLLDEVLTHSAARFAATGDERWRDRYDTAVVALDQVLAFASENASAADLGALDQVDGANQALIAFETQAFELGEQGRLAAAQAVLGPAYDEQKAVYSDGVDRFSAMQRTRLEQALNDREDELSVNVVVGSTLCLVLTGALIVLLSVHRRERATTIEQAERLRALSRRDPLTGLANRLGAIEAIDRALDELGPHDEVAALFVDLDGFKSINDSFGHAAGDRVLVEIGRRFAAELADGDTLARLGGDEFLVVTNGPRAASHLAERLLAVAARPVLLDAATTAVSASVGVATAHDGDSADLLRKADQAVYEAKATGKRRLVTFDESLSAKVGAAALLERDIHAALTHDELSIHLQPIIEPVGQRTLGAEALVRWHHPTQGLLLPGAFIPIAEQSWLIVEIGRAVLLQACRVLARWQHAELDLYIAVNVSGRHEIHGDLVADVREALSRSGAMATGLVVELTETHLIADLDKARDVLDELRALGVRMSLDDFGDGHASLGYLRRLPFDAVKVDSSYIADIERPDQAALVAVLMDLARVLGLTVVAEGVEREVQLDALRTLGCDSCQGYLIARPMPPDDFEQWLAVRAAASPH
jgi:diguanylate cyclase (GGDEF)-like protein